ncbi:hypothetical protein ABIE78_002913 [Sinorhizobium fredii]
MRRQSGSRRKAAPCDAGRGLIHGPSSMASAGPKPNRPRPAFNADDNGAASASNMGPVGRTNAAFAAVAK